MQKTICITGATSGFGKACAERFAREGWRLIVTGRRVDRLQELTDQLHGVPVHAVQLDVRDLAAVKTMASNLPEGFRDIDVLVNNAGLALGLEGAHEASLDDWETMIDTNIKGLCYLTRCLLPAMVARNQGHIINMGSIAGNYPYPGGNVYGATKAFVKQFSRNLLTDLIHTKIRVTNIEPGLAESEFSIVRFHGDKDKADAVYKGTQPLTPVDIAEIVHWVTSVPPHVNICTVEVMPVCQSCGPLAVHREA
ncbi:short-chain dehydrogenase/reductase SDR [Desulfobulbus propionicus DSM 2032]|uniref:Short-chain dehydrogenase/reductase SDR n=1 Tax=Desulfobulbus propionicus (strain ATCC 33891 / DSM 2032 / VKM B-1956 / 1pr3) TaxID=577650 RepID=A0A7U4DQE6_DESPD|nr:SDR family oxidoreductase [Desulfobulbus propionicus]ADW19141.1 short-chain dehydrogenase/reductase SDR [Desulfobulbus propionicus DSM 2032]